MIESIKNLFNKQTPDLEFVDHTRMVYPHHPILLAKDLKPFFKEFQEKDEGKYNFPGCPGMYDYSRLGYIIPAWIDIHIKANKAGTVIRMGSKEDSKRASPFPPPQEITRPISDPYQMATDVTEGLFQFEDNIKPTAWNLPGVWKIYGKRNISALLLPAVFHSPFLEDLYVYPGVVDYSTGFTVANFIMSPRRRCEITIKAGTPLLHVIPLMNTKDFVASYGPGTTEQQDSYKTPKHMFEGNWYRRWYMVKKRFSLKKQVE